MQQVTQTISASKCSDSIGTPYDDAFHTILLRLFEYDSHFALLDHELKDHQLTVRFPCSALIYLRSTRSTPDYLDIPILTADGEALHRIPVMKLSNYTMEDLFAKKLLFLIPFYIFNYERHFSLYDSDPEKLLELETTYQNILLRLHQTTKQGECTHKALLALIDMTKYVMNSLCSKYTHIKERLGKLMGGKILEYESKTKWRKAQYEIIYSYIKKGWITLQQAADDIHLTEAELLQQMSEFGFVL